LNKEGQSVIVSVEKEIKLRIPIHTLGGIVCFGNIMCSPFLMAQCAKNGVNISFFNAYGRFLARVQGPVSGNILLRREQYKRSDDLKQSAIIARSILIAKSANSRTVLQRTIRDHGENKDLQIAVTRLGRIVEDMKKEQSPELDSLRGREGDSSRVYFDVFDHLITSQKDDFFFHGRNRRPPMDNMNALLSFIYTLLAHDCIGALEGVGLDPQAGFLHRIRPGRPSLALDLMEEFRSFFADRLALSLVNLRQVNGKGFKHTETGAVEMNDDTRKTLLTAYQKRKQEEIMHPFIKEKASLGIAIHLQAQLLARYLRGDLDGYPPFIWK
jgi:CRISPR-associated protein Cas1